VAVHHSVVAVASVFGLATVVSTVPLALQMPNQELLMQAEKNLPWQLSLALLVRSPFQCFHHVTSQTTLPSILNVSHFQSYAKNK
jgi:hypothetical protein